MPASGHVIAAVLVLIASATLTGCAARRAAPPARDVIAEVDRLVREGCHACLRDALNLLPSAGLHDKVRFDVLVLLASRAGQLELDGDPDWLSQARELAASPSAAQQLLLDLATLTASGLRGYGSGSTIITPAMRDDLAERVRALLLPAASTDPAAAYFAAHARCLDLLRAEEIRVTAADPPLVRYRAATCAPLDWDALDAITTAQPRYDEVRYFSATAAFAAGQLLTAERELDRFDASFGQSRSSALLRAQILMALEEFEPALIALDTVLARQGDHPEALLHRMRALGQLGDAERGEAAANRLIAVGTWYQGEAYYWRAWNRRALGRLDEAAADIETAKRVLFNAAVPKLAGFIAYERDDMALAMSELSTSRERNGGDCEVLFAIGQVHGRERRWPDAASAFESTITCALDAQQAATDRLQEIAAAPLDQARRERMRARAESARARERAREGVATFNAAAAASLAGRHPEARRFAERAAAWEEWAAKARELLGKLPR